MKKASHNDNEALRERMIGITYTYRRPGSLYPTVIDIAVLDAICAVSFDQTSAHCFKSELSFSD